MKRSIPLALCVVLTAASAVHAQSLFGTNLVVNGDAETGPAQVQEQNQPAIPGWTRSGNGTPVVLSYVDGPILDGTSPGPYNRGQKYFNGGVYTTSATLAQDIDLSSGASIIDAGGVTYTASAYLGGNSEAKIETAFLNYSFLSASGTVLSELQLGPVDCSDENLGIEGLYNRAYIGLLPSGTRKVHVVLTFTGAGDGGTDGSADNVSLVLTAPRSVTSITGQNLVVNGGAESGPAVGSEEMIVADVPGWCRVGQFDVDHYGVDGDIDPSAPGPPDRGKNFFWGGNAALASGYQDIDISPAATQIDLGAAQYTASAYLGGYEDQDDSATVAFLFEKWDGTVLKTVTLGPVTSADRVDATELLARSDQGVIPAGTRKVHVLVTMTRQEGSNNDGYVDSISLMVNPGGRPAITAGGVITAGSFGASKVIGPGTWIEIYGSNLSSSSRSWTGNDFIGAQAPTSLDGVSVTIGGKSAYLMYIAPGQVDALVPDDVAPGQTTITVTNGAVTSDPYTIIVQSPDPGLLASTVFLVNGKQYAAAMHSDGSFVGPSATIPGVYAWPAAPGETIVLYGIGFGPVIPSTPAGLIASQATSMVDQLQVTIGGVPATVSYKGMAGGFVGLYQFNVVVPGIPDNDAAPLVFSVNGTAVGQTLYTAVRHQP